MNDKKWYENIPKNGVLCKTESDETQFVHIRNKQDLLEFCCDYAVDESFLTKITPAEFWQFAPWQDIKTAPLLEPVLLLRNGVVYLDKLYNEDKREVFEKWLPLPQPPAT